MKNTISIIIGVSMAIVGGIFITLNIGNAVAPIQVEGTDFNFKDVLFTEENIEFINEIETDENGVETIVGKTGIRVPIKYDFPILDEETGNYVVEEVDGVMEMNFDGYNDCRGNGKTQTVCLEELNDDITSNVGTFKLNIEQELKELQESKFQDEVKLLDL